MLRYILIYLSIAAMPLPVAEAKDQPPFGQQPDPLAIHGIATNCLEPVVLLHRSPGNWNVDIQLLARSNFVANSWLKALYQTGSKLQIWSTNGTELRGVKQGAPGTSNIPVDTTVSEVLRSVQPRDRRGLQWWPVASMGIKTGESYTLAAFDLATVTDNPITNDVVLQITPIIYRVETNRISAHLVEFPSIKIKLLSTGTIRKIGVLDSN